MATLCKTYPSADLARQAVAALRAAGVPGRNVRLLLGGREHDVRREPVGSFAGTVRPEARVGNFGGALRLRYQGRGAYAGDPDRQRQGSFADTDGDVILTGDGHCRTADDRVVHGLLEAAIPGESLDHTVADLHHGRAVVLVDLPDVPLDEAEARLEAVA
jgi:hypothetical protein